MTTAERDAWIEALVADLEVKSRGLQIIADELRELREHMQFAIGATPIADERQMELQAAA